MRLSRFVAWGLLLALPAFAMDSLPRELEGVGVSEKIGASVDPSLTFTAENGYSVKLGEFLNEGRPVVLNLVYYSCPMLCNLVLNGQTAALREIPWTSGKEFEVVTISIDPKETFDLAQRKRASYLASYGRPASGWHFLTDREGSAKKLAEQTGFGYKWDEATQQYAHAAVVIFLTPEGKIARYLYGIQFNPMDVRLAITEASQSKMRFSVEQLLLLCFHYDPQARGYVLFATNFMRAGGALVVLVLSLVLFRLWRRELHRSATISGEVTS